MTSNLMNLFYQFDRSAALIYLDAQNKINDDQQHYHLLAHSVNLTLPGKWDFVSTCEQNKIT